MRVLFVDDDESVRSFLAAFCESLGIDFDIVGSGHDALEACEKEDYTLCVTDITMPRMNGVELAEIMRKDFPEMVIFAFTGESSIVPLKRLDAAFDKVFLKPTDYSRMIAESMKLLAIKKYPFLA